MMACFLPDAFFKEYAGPPVIQEPFMIRHLVKSILILVLIAGAVLGTVAGMSWYQSTNSMIEEPDREHFQMFQPSGADGASGSGGGKKSVRAKSPEKSAAVDAGKQKAKEQEQPSNLENKPDDKKGNGVGNDKSKEPGNSANSPLKSDKTSGSK